MFHPVKTPRQAVALFLGVLLVAVLFPGCRKSDAQQNSAAVAPTQQTSPDSSTPGKPVFNPKRAPIAGIRWSPALQTAFDAAAQTCASYQTAMPYERERILESALLKIESALALYNAEASKTPNLENISKLIHADFRFSGVVFQPAFQTVLAAAPIEKDGESLIRRSTTVKDVGANNRPDEPKFQNGPAASVSHVSPASVVNGVSSIGTQLANGTEADQAAAEMAREAVRIVNLIEINGGADSSIFILSTNDSPNVRAAKVGIQAVYDDFLSKVVVYKESLFVGAVQTGGELQIWELKQPFVIGPSRDEPDTKTRLNMGVELTADFTISADADDPLFREYENGFWGTWQKPPPLNSVHLTKAGDWTIERKPPDGFLGFSLLSAEQIDAALQRTDTTRLIGKAEQASLNGGTLSATELATLILSYSARGDAAKAAECAQALSQMQLSASDAKLVASSLSELLCRVNPTIGLGFYQHSLFDYYASYKNLDFIPVFNSMGVAKRGADKHPYKQVPFKILKPLISAYEKITEEEPENLDAKFDLALLLALSASARSDIIKANDDLKLAANNLGGVIAKSPRQTSPASGRNFSQILNDTPCFVPLAGSLDQDLKTQFEAILKLSGSSTFRYSRKFSKAISYYNEGY
jgi:hypothetical protein